MQPDQWAYVSAAGAARITLPPSIIVTVFLPVDFLQKY